MNLDKPVIILGAPRSGTTFLGDLLATHSHLAFANEPSPIWRYGNEHRSDCLRPEWLTESKRRYIRERFERIVTENEKTRLLEKTPQNCLRIPFVEAVFPDAKYVHILRDPVETILSIRRMWDTNTSGFRGVRFSQRLKEMTLAQAPRYAAQFLKRAWGKATGTRTVMWGPLLPGIEKMAREMDLLEVAALQWRACTEAACLIGRTLPPERYREIELAELDEAKLRETLEFLELPSESELLGAFRTEYSSSRASHHRAKATPEQLKLIESFIAPTLSWLEKRLGDPACDGTNRQYG
ncbi:MAG: sulfotransferase [Opitutales bacterium]